MLISELTSQEKEFTKLICQQFNLDEISNILELTAQETKEYQTKIIEKIGAKNEVGILLFALRTGIFKI